MIKEVIFIQIMHKDNLSYIRLIVNNANQAVVFILNKIHNY